MVQNNVRCVIVLVLIVMDLVKKIVQSVEWGLIKKMENVKLLVLRGIFKIKKKVFVINAVMVVMDFVKGIVKIACLNLLLIQGLLL